MRPRPAVHPKGGLQEEEMVDWKPAKRISLESFKARVGAARVRPSIDIRFPTRNAIGAAVAAFAALSVAFGTPALAAGTGSPVNIVDPKVSGNAANVTSDDQLEITGLVTTQQAAQGNFFHQTTFEPFTRATCTTIASAPAGFAALIIKQVRINVVTEGQPIASQNAQIFVGNAINGSCGAAGQVSQINPPTVGQYVVPFDPGLALTPGSVLEAECTGAAVCQAYVDGFLVP
jgi:hypothetical protein